MKRVALIGCGAIGQKRASAILSMKNATLIACVDTNVHRAQHIASQCDDCEVFENHQALLQSMSIDAVIIATSHNALFDIVRDCLMHQLPCFIEKPGARNTEESKALLALAIEKKCVVQIGFNHRYHRAFQKARDIIDANELGDLMFIRARYGHGGRVGYEKEWRANPALSGGGELIDQGIHLIDLSRWFLGDLYVDHASLHTFFWNMPVEDNAFLTLKNHHQHVAFLHASCTEWKNTFSFEIYGKKGKLHIQGLGGSYGVESLTHYKMSAQMGPPETIVYEYPIQDNSWFMELTQFINGDLNAPNLNDANAALSIIDECYSHHTAGCER